ncbi:group II intron reverse transcriptase/maturase [Clostridium formicaceticum]|uniref:Group II intron reverse transcriptase/maturase n=1 Tax=Clostridium formicaceticum TaxID=1497 RepID=A0AAC9RLK1_9CLOT|nr:group II intron reverse transcriptase/maturase [Clostridium formicaceticum]AOY77259.1 group II intron reverse transcriptase/maturase [Clostridium formicaceticum]ARE87797.1 Group II intron-encoded protein LtrA [Clostridium formicaceticum]
MNTSTMKSALPNITDWQQIGWQEIEGYVEKLQQRIYHAESLGEVRKVRDLQRMLINSGATLLLSIRRVTQLNKGKKTAGVDGYKALTSNERLELYHTMKELNIKCHNPKPAYRTYIEKKNGKLRPLGIPTIKDRIYQNIVRMALEPQWEARFEPTSYGFRPKRNCHDAIERIFNTVKGGKKQWIFEGDFKGCFDNLNHKFITEQIKGFPQSELIEKWLKAGFVDNSVFNETDEGTPQGGIISPLLANIALHGMEETIGTKYNTVNRKDEVTYENRSKYAMARYADDFVIMCESEQDAIDLFKILKPYLENRGLELAQEKTKVAHITEGFDFLGFNIKRYKTESGSKLIIKPSKNSIKSFKGKISDKTKMLYGKNIQTLINTLNPIIIGTANYWSSVVSKEVYTAMDNYVWVNVYRFLRRLHPKKSWKWIKEKYFKPDKTGQSKNKWILTDPITNNQLKKMAWTSIVRHQQVKHNYSLYNRELKEYFYKRDIKEFHKNNVAYRKKLAKKQEYKCPLCGMSITDFKEGLETHHKIPKVKGGSDDYRNLQLVHISCHIEYHKLFPVKEGLPDEAQLRNCLKFIKNKKSAGLI